MKPSFSSGSSEAGASVGVASGERLIGRRDELIAIAAALRARQPRLLVLTGPGGVGKTRLAQQVATDVVDAFGDGVVFVPLAPVQASAQVLPAIARALGLWDAGEQPLAARLGDALQQRDLLLVLDNFEHLVPAAPAVAALLARCPGVTTLVTSRARLNVVGEHVLPVMPLSLSDIPRDLSTGTANPAVQLFLERARAAAPDFALTTASMAAVASICRRLDGLPLAIELAAAWTRALTPAALLARLDDRLTMLVDGPRDRASRQQSMRATIAWSYDLLSPTEQRYFRRLAVFAGGWTLQAAEAVTRVPDGSPITLGELVTLADYSLLRVVTAKGGEPRFSMLETIREYGLEHLVASGEDATVRSAHAGYFLMLAERLEPELYGGREIVTSLDVLEREYPNARSALDWLERVDDPWRQLRLAAAVWRFWLMRGYLNEGRARLDRALHPSEAPAETRAKALTALALIAWPQHAQQQALAALDQAVALVEGTPNLEGLALVRLAQAWIALDQGELVSAARWATESKARYEQLGWRWAALHATSCLARVTFARGDPRRAEGMYKSLLTATQEAGDDYGLATARHSLGRLLAAQRDYSQALALQVDALRSYQALGERLWIAVCLEAMAAVAGAIDQYEDAARLTGAATAIRTKIGLLTWFADRDALTRTREAASAALGEPAYSAASAAGAAAPLDDIIAEAVRLAERESIASPPRPADKGLGPAGPLTPRERDVLRLLTKGMSNPEIGRALSISHRTVAGHVEGIFRKLEVDSRAAAAAKAVRQTLV